MQYYHRVKAHTRGQRATGSHYTACGQSPAQQDVVGCTLHRVAYSVVLACGRPVRACESRRPLRHSMRLVIRIGRAQLASIIDRSVRGYFERGLVDCLVQADRRCLIGAIGILRGHISTNNKCPKAANSLSDEKNESPACSIVNHPVAVLESLERSFE